MDLGVLLVGVANLPERALSNVVQAISLSLTSQAHGAWDD